MTIHIVTGSNVGYMEKILPYLQSLNQYAEGVKCWLCCVDCDPPIINLPKVKMVRVPREALQGSPSETESLQHGGWIPYIEAEDDDTVIFTDGDIFMQRKIAASELASLNTWPDDTFGVSFNMGPGETLLHEALFKLHPKVSDGAFLERWGRETLEHLCWNVGVMVAKYKTFKRLHELYMPLWDEIGNYLTHQARQQWLISYLIDTQFKYGVIGYGFHSHAHFDLPQGVFIGRDGTAYYEGAEILFWHLPMWKRHV